MNDILSALQGKKTKIQATLLIALGVAEAVCQTWGISFQVPEWAFMILGGGTAMSLRTGMKNSAEEVIKNVEGKKK